MDAMAEASAFAAGRIEIVMTDRSAAARRSAAGFRLGFPGANEGAGNLPIDLRGNVIDVDARFRQKRPRILDVVDAPWFDGDIHEAGLFEPRGVIRVLESAGDASDPQLQAALHFPRNLAAHDDVRDGEAAARLQHAERL